MDVLQSHQREEKHSQVQSDPVSADIIRTIIDAGIKAPSGKNRQPWEFIVVTGDKRAEMVRAMRAGIEASGPAST